MVRADRVTAFILIALGLVMLWGGYTMDRLEIRAIHPASIPGLVPMGLGVLITVCGGLLLVSSRGQGSKVKIDFGNIDKLIWTGVLCLIFAVIFVGRLPFFVATFLFIFAFSARFTWYNTTTKNDRIKKLFAALAMGLVFSTLISALFLYAFLVRLP